MPLSRRYGRWWVNSTNAWYAGKSNWESILATRPAYRRKTVLNNVPNADKSPPKGEKMKEYYLDGKRAMRYEKRWTFQSSSGCSASVMMVIDATGGCGDG